MSNIRFDATWQRIMADPELTRARTVLSFHELRRVVQLVHSALTIGHAVGLNDYAKGDVKALPPDGAAWIRLATAADYAAAQSAELERLQAVVGEGEKVTPEVKGLGVRESLIMLLWREIIVDDGNWDNGRGSAALTADTILKALPKFNLRLVAADSSHG